MLRSAASRRTATLASGVFPSHASRCSSSRSFSRLVLIRERSQNMLRERQRMQNSIGSSKAGSSPVIFAAGNNTNRGHRSNHKNNSSGGGSNFGRGGNHNNRNNNKHEVPTCAYISALAAIMGLYVLSHIDDEAEHAVMSTETTWVDLLQLVHDDKVERIVVTDNNTVARIYVMEERINGDEKDKTRVHSEKLPVDETGNNSIGKDTTQMQFGDAKSNEKSTKASSIPWSSSFHHDGIEAPSRTSGQSQKVYRLSIDASFEEKLEEAQRKYGRNRTNFIPVEYRPGNTTDESPVLTAAARIAFIGVVSGMIRIITKRPGSGFGGRTELSSSLGLLANNSLGSSLSQLRRMKALGVAMVPLLTRVPSSWTKAQPSNSWRSVFTYSRK